MNTIFKYKQKFFPKLIIFIIFILFSLAVINYKIFFFILFCIVFLLLQILIHIYYMSKRLIITNKGIERKIFWNVSFDLIEWSKIEEAYELQAKKSRANAFVSLTEPFFAHKWFGKNSIGTAIKIIIEKDEPFYIFLKDIKKSPDLYNILKDKIKFRK